MAEVLSPVPIQDYQISGLPAVGAQVFIYAAGTTTKITTYLDSTGNAAQSNPIKLNARGEPQNTMGASVGIWIPAGTLYKMVFAPSTDTDPPTNPIWTVDNISSGGVLPTSYIYLNFDFTGSSPPVTNAQLGGWNIPAAATFPGNFATPNSYFHSDTNPAATFVMSVLRNGSSIGTISVTTGGVATFTTSSGNPVVLAAGDRIEVFGPSTVDTAINNFFGTLAGTWT